MRRFEAIVDAQGWRREALSPRVTLAVGPGPSLGVESFGSWRLIGDVFRRGPAWSREIDTPEALIDQVWGRYVAIRLDEDGGLAAVLRDPSGALDALIIRNEEYWAVTSELPDWVLTALRPQLHISEARVGGVLQDPTRAWDASLLSGVDSITAGAIVPFKEPPTERQVWRPSAFVDKASDLSVEAASGRLRDVVDDVVKTFASRLGVVAAELSGGLDSSIVATSLKRSDCAVKHWLHSYGAAPESDERSFALPLARQLGVELEFLERPDSRFSLRDLEGLSRSIRPGFNAMDPINDGIAAARLKALNIDAVLTGKGGDAVFFQAFGQEVYADLRRNHGVQAWWSSTLPSVARWEGRSIWSVMAGGAARPEAPALRFLTKDQATLPPHPWLEANEVIGPAKRLQIVGLLDGIGFSARSLQTDVADIRHPLLSQLVMETCLAIPADRLTLGRDRGLARLAFADRLTPQIAARRSKGDLTAYYGRLIARSLDTLRPWLLDGELASRGLIDRERTEQVLSADHLIWRGGYRDIMVAAAMESWLRTWRARLDAARTSH